MDLQIDEGSFWKKRLELLGRIAAAIASGVGVIVVVKSIKRGEIVSRTGSVLASLDAEPRTFWIQTAARGAMILFCAYLAIFGLSRKFPWKSRTRR